MKKTQDLWETSPSGIIFPAGHIADRQDRFKTTYLEVKSKGEQIEKLYKNNGLTLPDNSDLSELIKNTKALWEKWFTNKTAELEMGMLFNLLHLDRIADAVLPLKDEPKRAKYLKALISGPLAFFKRERSYAKDIFWELEVWLQLRKKLTKVNLEDPPDIVIELEESRIGIACKKLYSEKHVQNVLSEAVHQIEDSFKIGIVALNLDDFTPANRVLKSSHTKGMTEKLQNINADFIQKHERHLRKYLASGRLIASIVSTSVIADVTNDRPQFNNAFQWTIWSIPGLEEEKSQILHKLQDLMMR